MLTPTAWLAPHVPTLLVDAHRGHHTEMLEALADASEELGVEAPDTVVIVSARWSSAGPFLVDDGRRHRTIIDYTGFGVEARYDCDGDPALARALVDAGVRAGLRVAPAQRGVDSGVTVPLRFLFPERDRRVVPLSVADRAPDECRRWGAALRAALAARPERVVFVVGGLVSFDPHSWQLGRDQPQQREFDARALELLRAGAWDDLDRERAALPDEHERTRGAQVLVENAWRHLDVLRGFLGGDVGGELRCYEPSPGAGAALMAFPVVDAPTSPPAQTG